MPTNPTPSILRLEKKYTLPSLHHHQLTHLILNHPLGIYQNYPPRQVNSLYFDSSTLAHHTASLNGDFNRVKPRLRWYGTNTNKVTSGQLEFKIKRGHLGYKETFKLEKLNLIINPSTITTAHFLKKTKNKLPIRIINQIAPLTPTLLTSYFRQYFITANKQVRLTIDTNLRHTDLFTSINHTSKDPRLVLELKYHPNSTKLAQTITQSLPLNLNRMSKYTEGIGF